MHEEERRVQVSVNSTIVYSCMEVYTMCLAEHQIVLFGETHKTHNIMLHSIYEAHSKPNTLDF